MQIIFKMNKSFQNHRLCCKDFKFLKTKQRLSFVPRSCQGEFLTCIQVYFIVCARNQVIKYVIYSININPYLFNWKPISSKNIHHVISTEGKKSRQNKCLNLLRIFSSNWSMFLMEKKLEDFLSRKNKKNTSEVFVLFWRILTLLWTHGVNKLMFSCRCGCVWLCLNTCTFFFATTSFAKLKFWLSLMFITPASISAAK